MKTYKMLLANRKTKDSERSVLPTILYAGSSTKEDGITITCRAVTIGWWAWGIGIMQTKVTR